MNKMVLTILLLFLGSCELRADYRGGNFKIAVTAHSENAPHLIENDIIKGEIDSFLHVIDTITRLAVRPGQLIMRRKFETESYGFYRGVLDTAAFTLRPPLFSFPFPHWARCEDMLQYRFYRLPTESIGADETILYFDNERLYTRFYSRLYYFRNGIWFPLDGSAKKPVGSISIHSNPSGAGIVVDGAPTGRVSPDTIEGLIGGVHTIELRLSNYQFFRKKIRIVPDSTVSASFELIADVDTVFITGEASYGLLLLPEPPLDRPYVVDDSVKVYTARIRLAPGSHRLQWDGDERYVPVDSVIEIPEGKVVYFDYLFERRYGIVRLIPFPADAEICIDQFGCGTGERVEELPAGFYRINTYRLGFQKVKHDLHVIADTITSLRIDLRQVPDGDGDGYIDSLDVCPKEYGLYNGCPTPHLKTAVKGIVEEISDFVATDSLTFGFSLMGIVSKTPTNQHFRNFLSVFSSGKTGGVNNYRGMTILNSFSILYRGLFGIFELGQWSAGLHYQRSDTLYLNPNHIVYFDSLLDVEPRVYFPSTAVGLGFHYNRSWLNIAYAIGYQWEDIILDQIFSLSDNSLVQVTFDNDWWFHQVNIEADFNHGDLFVPSLYCTFKFPFGPYKRTRWMALNAGLQMKIFTHPFRYHDKERHE
ncbi:MAG: PEGA domain-containing protein [Chitinispirillaceae bacterium]|nr:PEGA domain-containing protein [Chitinispirillaceae bacterium]